MQAVKAALKPDAAAAAWSARALAGVDFDQIARLVLQQAKPVRRVKDASTMDVETFECEYEQTSTPVLLGGLMKAWPPMGANLWRLSGLQAAGTAAGGVVFEVGDDPRREGSVLCELDDFVEYMKRDSDGDDEPVYLFDGTFETSLPALLEAYVPPPMMAHDLLGVIEDLDDRPPFRWVICGGRRSGSALHKDPLATAAWNTLAQGRKLWVLVPPGAPSDLLFLTESKLRPPAAAAAAATNDDDEQGNEQHDQGDDDQGDTPLGPAQPVPTGDQSEPNPGHPLGPARWFAHGLPRLLDLAASRQEPPASSAAQSRVQVFAAVQEAGETIFVPHGWWHAVLNLDDVNLAVTQNFASPHNLRAVVEALAEEQGGPAAGDLLRRLAAREQWPELQSRLQPRHLAWMELAPVSEGAGGSLT